MKIFLDDVRDPPDHSWVLLRSVWKFSEFLIYHWDAIEVISFDHDLGCEIPYHGEVTGYDCLKLVELYQLSGRAVSFDMTVHSANPVGIEKMNKLIQKIKERTQ